MIPEDICKVLVVVESEFDAILLNQEAGHLAGIIALGSAQTRPDKRAAELLRAADLILVSLDSDDHRSDGKNPGAKEAWGWWMKHFEQARRLPPIDGKDPGEMWKAGVSLSEWVRIGIEKYQQEEAKGCSVQVVNSPALGRLCQRRLLQPIIGQCTPCLWLNHSGPGKSSRSLLQPTSPLTKQV